MSMWRCKGCGGLHHISTMQRGATGICSAFGGSHQFEFWQGYDSNVAPELSDRRTGERTKPDETNNTLDSFRTALECLDNGDIQGVRDWLQAACRLMERAVPHLPIANVRGRG